MNIIDIGDLANNPKFGSLEIHGTCEEPLFPVRQIARLLKCPQVRVDRGNYERGLDYVVMIVPARGGVLREQNMLTEQGLYNVIFRSNTAVGREFRIFVGDLLKKLRISGMVRIDDVLTQIALTTPKEERIDALYFITDGEWTKIGRSIDPEARCRELQTGNARVLSVVRIFPGCGVFERLIHIRAAPAPRRGEWFLLPDRDVLAAWIETLVD